RRSSDLADSLRAHGALTCFLSPFLSGEAEARILKSGHELRHVNPRHVDAWGERNRSGGWMVVDTYAATSDDLERLASTTRVAVIDDLADRDLRSASLVINPAASSADVRYEVDPRGLLTGSEYALVQSRIARARDEVIGLRQFPKVPSKVAVALGGYDTEQQAPSVIEALLDWDLDVRVAGDVGIQQREGVEWLGMIGPADLVRLIEWSDLFVATPSTVAWELATVGAPAILQQTVANQSLIAAWFREAGVPVVQRASEIGSVFTSLQASRAREELSARMAAICDGGGAERVAIRMLEA
ncbi:MAG: hypothetical protein ACF8LL_07235, partial [Phycisphaerales bacterium]